MRETNFLLPMSFKGFKRGQHVHPTASKIAGCNMLPCWPFNIICMLGNVR